MAKTAGTFHKELRIFGIKICDVKHEYIQLNTEEDTEEIRDDIIMHEILFKENYYKNK